LNAAVKPLAVWAARVPEDTVAQECNGSGIAPEEFRIMNVECRI